MLVEARKSSQELGMSDPGFWEGKEGVKTPGGEKYPDRTEGQKTESDPCPEQRILSSHSVLEPARTRSSHGDLHGGDLLFPGRNTGDRTSPVEKEWEGGRPS